MQLFIKNNQAHWHARDVVAKMAPALISSLWYLIVIICLVVLLAAAARPQTTAGGWPRTIQSDGIRA
jgi:hypothetical protein